MIDLGWTELFFLAVILIVVVGPKDLPGVLRGLGRIMRKVRSLADEFRRGVDEFIRESELEELNDGVERVRNFNLDQIKAEGRPRNRGGPAAGGASGKESSADTSSEDNAAPAGDAVEAASADTETSASKSPSEPDTSPDTTDKKREE